MKYKYKSIFEISDSNKIKVHKLDVILCIILSLFCILAYHIYALLVYKTPFLYIALRTIPNRLLVNNIAGLVFAIIMIIPIIIVLNLRNQPLISVGITKRNIAKSIFLGLVFFTAVSIA